MWDSQAANAPIRTALPVAVALFFAVQAVAVTALQPLDLDGDGLSTLQEWREGTRADLEDTDRDGLPDGWETQRALSARNVDSDADGVADRREVDQASDPLSTDTDGDGLLDGEDLDAADAQCDGDGAEAVNDPDHDNDGRRDGDEPVAQRCRPDVDLDGVLDGDERAVRCVTLTDCDADGVEDGEEVEQGYDPLDPDTFEAHLPDGITLAFAREGQAAGADEDRDGIPDPWETGGGLIDWGPYSPMPGRRDLLVEFVRVLGPDSARYADLPVGLAYERIRQAYAAEDVTIQYQASNVHLPTEPEPALVPTRNATYYRDVLDAAPYATNPFVVTVVLNPQHDQSEILHAGVAPIRGMLAAVETSRYVETNWRSVDGNYTITFLTPFIESLIKAGRIDETTITGGSYADGTYWMLVGPEKRELRWNPSWFRDPRIQHTDGTWVPLVETTRSLADAELASVIMHEMGHTLGLCHTHEADCQAGLPVEDRARQAESSMSYVSAEDTVAYLPGEWAKVHDYLTCPPPGPIGVVAGHGTMDELLDAKYAYSLESAEDVGARTCQDFVPLVADLAPSTESAPYAAPAGQAPPPMTANSVTATAVFGLASLVAGLGAASFLFWRLRGT